MDQALQRLRDDFTTGEKPAERILQMYQQVWNSSRTFPFSSVGTLDGLLSKLFEDKDLEKPFVVLGADLSRDINPSSTFESFGKMVSRYQFYFLGRDIHLGVYDAAKIPDPKMHVKAKVSDGTSLKLLIRLNLSTLN